MTFFFFNDTTTTNIYTLSLHDALPISNGDRKFLNMMHDILSREAALDNSRLFSLAASRLISLALTGALVLSCRTKRSEEHTSELQSRRDLVCRLLLEKKKTYTKITYYQ